MDDVLRLLLMLAVAGGALTLLGGVAIWMRDETRCVRRGLKRILRGEPHALVTAPGTGRGAGFNFTTNEVAVAWDAGAWGLIYRVDELMGAEAVIDGQVAARVHRGESRRALDILGDAEKLVRLRLIFDDAAHPDFLLDLWTVKEAGRKGAYTAIEASEEANRWLARVDAILRRPVPVRGRPAPVPPADAEAPLGSAAPRFQPAPPPFAQAFHSDADVHLDEDTDQHLDEQPELPLDENDHEDAEPPLRLG